MLKLSSVSKIAFVLALAGGTGLPSIAEAGLKKQAKKILAIVKNPVDIAVNASGVNLNVTSPVQIKNGLSCQSLYLDSAHRDSASSKVILPGQPMEVKSVKGTIKIGTGSSAQFRQVIDNVILNPATGTRGPDYLPAHTAAPSLAMPPLNHAAIDFGLLRPNYQEWATGSEEDDILFMTKGQDSRDYRNTENYLTMILRQRSLNEFSAPVAASGSQAGIAIMEVCVGPK